MLLKKCSCRCGSFCNYLHLREVLKNKQRPMKNELLEAATAYALSLAELSACIVNN
jgi:hypothetical protein